MANSKEIFGYCSILRNYGIKGFLKDAIIPFCITVALCVIAYCNDANITIMLKRIVDIGISVLPSIISFTLVSYAIVTIFMTKKDSVVDNKLKSLKRSLNANFAFFMGLPIFSIILIIVISIVLSMNIVSEWEVIVNYIAFSIVVFFLLTSIFVLKNVIVDIYNICQYIIHEDRD